MSSGYFHLEHNKEWIHDLATNHIKDNSNLDWTFEQSFKERKLL